MNLIPERAYGIRLEQILDFLNYKENPNLADYFDTTLLHFAVANNYDNFAVVEKLIKAGANINAQNICRQTPLHLAVLRHNWRIMDTLIAHNADINIQELKGNTALHIAVDLFWREGKLNHQETRSWIVKKLLHHGANPNISNSNGESPLMLAVKNGDLAIVKDLLAFGANVHFRNQFSKTCLHLLSLCPIPNIAVLKELVTYGACVNCCDEFGRTALDVLMHLDKFGYGKRAAETLIKMATLVNWKHKIVFLSKKRWKCLEEFMDRCSKEVSRMKSFVYSDKSNLCHFAINCGNVGKKGKSYRKNVFDEVLDTLTKEDFPIYEDCIGAHFDEMFLKEKLFEMNIYARNKGKVLLHSYAVSNIAYYLSSRDLLNLFRAYSKPLRNSLVNDKIDLSAKCSCSYSY